MVFLTQTNVWLNHTVNLKYFEVNRKQLLILAQFLPEGYHFGPFSCYSRVQTWSPLSNANVLGRVETSSGNFNLFALGYIKHVITQIVQ